MKNTKTAAPVKKPAAAKKPPAKKPAAKKPAAAVAPAKAAAAIVDVAASAAGGYYSEQTLANIRISPDNRKKFNEAALQELAASITSMGVAQPILIRPVTPSIEQPEAFEIVAGERRYRASIIAGRTTIPAMCRILSDLDAAKIRILENLQREDPHPMEEADGYQQLMLQHGYSADQLADEIKKSRSYVFGRLKLCSLTTEVREQFLNDDVSASVALLIARIPVPLLQARALNEILHPLYGEPLSYRRAQQLLQERYMLNLSFAKFPIADAKLLASAGACTTCPKRTGNQPEIFNNISADVCTDPDCLKEKNAALFARQLVDANKLGIPVFEGDEAATIRSRQWEADFEYVTEATMIHSFARNAPSTGNAGVVCHHLTHTQMPSIAGYIKDAAGTMTAVFSRAAMQQALESAGACETVEVHAARMKDAEDSGEPIAQAERDRLDRLEAADVARDAKIEESEKQVAFRIALYKKLRQRGDVQGFRTDSLRAFVKMLTFDFSLPGRALGDIYPFDSADDEAVREHIDQAGREELQLLMIDFFIGDAFTVNYWNINTNGSDANSIFDTLVDMAELEGIDPAAVMESLYPVAAAQALEEVLDEGDPVVADGEDFAAAFEETAAPKKESKPAKKTCLANNPAWPFPNSSKPAQAIP